ncbi:hypothetical protein [Acidovorax sp. Leaf78]|uniref:hypothetical protein n=1 Tax=unclassified Acidovorax TaxID=2684926 RepID=UPI0006FF6EEF|nr:hypothetical protein [Acidovorax sp. Leaf78]KQO19500.1 hypothetical protein ASF16_05815 [Acidovorax sp. Leaf78]
MPADLRLIAVHVEEDSAGGFEWVLSERDGRTAWGEIQRSASAAGTYKDAMAGGLVALEAMVEDLDIGPRSSTAPHASHAFRAARAAHAPSAAKRAATEREPSGAAEAEQKTPGKPSPFGFGPAV